MGWWSDLWSGIKNVGNTIWSGVKSGVNWVADKVKPVSDAIQKYAGYVPIIGQPLASVAGTVSNVIDYAKKGVDAATAAGYRRGGVVQMTKKFQAS